MNDSINNQKSPEVKALEDRRAQSSVLSQEQIDNLQRNDQYHYAIRVEEYEESITSLKGTYIHRCIHTYIHFFLHLTLCKLMRMYVM
jgi:hypothetical protein